MSESATAWVVFSYVVVYGFIVSYAWYLRRRSNRARRRLEER